MLGGLGAHFEAKFDVDVDLDGSINLLKFDRFRGEMVPVHDHVGLANLLEHHLSCNMIFVELNTQMNSSSEESCSFRWPILFKCGCCCRCANTISSRCCGGLVNVPWADVELNRAFGAPIALCIINLCHAVNFLHAVVEHLCPRMS